MESNRARDALRFKAWQLDALEARPAGTELLSVGPFRVVISSEPGADSWVTLVDGDVMQSDLQGAVGRLRSMFARRKTELQIEFNESVAPQAGAWLEASGLRQTERNPLMACRPDGFRPFFAEGVVLKQLRRSSPASDLAAFQEIRWTDGGAAARPVPPVTRLQQDLAAPNGVYLLAVIDGRTAGTGVSHSLKGAAEIVGIVTRMDSRRRGVAATVSSSLVERHFARGGDFVFLDAANQEAARVYERLGFARFGANVVYR
ncbi:MAG TPA: GNAT family N-acetyltransferase [Candidatus Dormibacteraeota bacterium]|nr:GNAT family N-acetyltransferase [Candidatus Dormibacteraeota bacterium]